MVLARYLLAAFVLCLPVKAALLYTFTYTPSTGIINSFTFSISSSTFITTSINPLPPFTPFTVTDSMSNTFTLTQGRADFDVINNAECFTFGSASGATISNCGGSASGGSVLLVDFKPPPAAVGTYPAFIFQGNFGSNPADFINSSPGTGTMSLTISEVADGGVPEPCGIFLGTTGLACLLLMRQRRAGSVRSGSHRRLFRLQRPSR